MRLWVLVFCVLVSISYEQALALRPASRVRFLLVGDRFSPDSRGEVAKADADRFERLLRETFRPQDKVTIERLGEDKAITPQALLDYYARLSSLQSEVLVFYYSGKGSYTRGTNGWNHTLELSGGNLPRNTLRSAMERKNPRLLVLLTDSATQQADVFTPAQPPITVDTRTQKLFRDLFFTELGVVDVNSNGTAENSWMTGRHGIFSQALTELLFAPDLDALDENKDNVVRWREFFAELTSQTQKKLDQLKLEAGEDQIAPSEKQSVTQHGLPISKRFSETVMAVQRTITPDWVESGKKGLFVQVTTLLEGLEYRELRLGLFFTNAGGFLRDRDGVYRNDDGNVAFRFAPFRVPNAGYLHKDSVFVPYEQLHSGRGTHPVGLILAVYDRRTGRILASGNIADITIVIQ